MTKTISILTAFLTVFLVACTGGGNSNTSSDNTDENAAKQEEGIRPTVTKVMGPLKDYFEVVDKPYKISDKSFAKINVEFKRLAGQFPLKSGEQFVANKYSSDAKKTGGLAIEMTIEFIDEEGNVIETALSDNHELIRLAGFDEGDTGMVSFFLPRGKTPAKFRITSEMEHVKAGAGNNNSDADEDLKKAAEAIGAMGEAMGDVMDAASKAADAASKMK